MGFSQDVKMQAMVACGRCCAICHKFCGNNMEVHHIIQKSDGGNNTFENAIPLCFNCHAEVGQYNEHHPKGIKFTSEELRLHRDNWYKKVAESPAVLEAPETRELDMKTYMSLEEYLSYDMFSFIRDLDFNGGKYEIHITDRLIEFTRVIMNPKYEYLDADLEMVKQGLADSIKQFEKDSFTYIFCDDGIYCRIPLDWKANYPELYYQGVEILNKSSMNIWERYCDYIRLCRRKLAVNEN